MSCRSSASASPDPGRRLFTWTRNAALQALTDDACRALAHSSAQIRSHPFLGDGLAQRSAAAGLSRAPRPAASVGATSVDPCVARSAPPQKRV
jgi:hypothetical protein